MQTSFEHTRMVKAWYDEIAQYDFGHLAQVDIPNKKCPKQWIIDMSQFYAHILEGTKSLVTKTCCFDIQIYYTSYFAMVFTHVGT